MTTHHEIESARGEGSTAFKSGQARSVNPYLVPSASYSAERGLAWHRGFDEASAATAPPPPEKAPWGKRITATYFAACLAAFMHAGLMGLFGAGWASLALLLWWPGWRLGQRVYAETRLAFRSALVRTVLLVVTCILWTLFAWQFMLFAMFVLVAAANALLT